jgi:hypothetical protein
LRDEAASRFAIRISPTGIGSGELISRGVVSFLGQNIERVVLVELGKDMAVYSNRAGSQTQRGDLIFWLGLHCPCSASDPATTGLTPEVEQIADAIVESIAMAK